MLNCALSLCLLGFLMTMNHKHHIEMMTIQRSKKKAEQKIVKLQSLLNEIRVSITNALLYLPAWMA